MKMMQRSHKSLLSTPGEVEEPVIRLIHPAICPIGGGTVLRLTGLHFCSQSAVRIGGKDAELINFLDIASGP